MAKFHENDVTVEHLRLRDGRGHLKVTHRPSGQSVDGYTCSEPMLTTLNRLMEELEAKVEEETGTQLEKHRAGRCTLP